MYNYKLLMVILWCGPALTCFVCVSGCQAQEGEGGGGGRSWGSGQATVEGELCSHHSAPVSAVCACMSFAVFMCVTLTVSLCLSVSGMSVTVFMCVTVSLCLCVCLHECYCVHVV